MTPLLTLDDLAARWQLSRRATRDIVREHGIPYLLPGGLAPMRVAWRRARFSLADIEAHEERMKFTCAATGKAESTATRPVAGRLGNWRG